MEQLQTAQSHVFPNTKGSPFTTRHLVTLPFLIGRVVLLTTIQITSNLRDLALAKWKYEYNYHLEFK